MKPSSIDTNDLAERLRQHATDLGFDLFGIAPAARPDTFEFLQQWLRRGMHGKMGYLSRREDAYAHPRGVLPSVRSVVMVGLNYKSPADDDQGTLGQIASYAKSTTDYHDLLRKRLRQLSQMLHANGERCQTRCVVDTAPLLERDFGQMAGLGWFGKNTMLINKYAGSFFFLGAVLTDLELPADEPHATDHCGTCTRCLDICPTDAFDGPRQLDARKCISYLTIELRQQSIPVHLRTGIQNWLFGCDLCQDVCPWNRKAPDTRDAVLSDRMPAISAEDFLRMSHSEFKARFCDTPFERTGRDALARNAAIVLGNSGSQSAVPALAAAAADESTLVRAACAWALGQVGGSASIAVLKERLQHEIDANVAEEIRAALQAACPLQ